MQEHEVINAVVASRVKTQAFADIPEEDSITQDYRQASLCPWQRRKIFDAFTVQEEPH